MRTTTDLAETLVLMELAPIHWEKLADDMTMDERAAITRTLESHAERAAMLASYLGAREGGGCVTEVILPVEAMA